MALTKIYLKFSIWVFTLQWKHLQLHESNLPIHDRGFQEGNRNAAVKKQQKCNDIIASLFENGGRFGCRKSHCEMDKGNCGPCRITPNQPVRKSVSKLKKI